MNQAILDNNHIATTSGLVTVFNYDGMTGEYQHSSEEFLSVGIGLPANACIDAPPKTKVGYIARRIDNMWGIVADHRDKKLYNTENGQPVTINELGALPPNTTVLAPNTRFDQWDGKEWVTDKAAQHAADVVTATHRRAELNAAANAAITPLADAVDLDMATENEVILLNNWRRYRVQLNRIDLDTAPDINWPTLPAKS